MDLYISACASGVTLPSQSAGATRRVADLCVKGLVAQIAIRFKRLLTKSPILGEEVQRIGRACEVVSQPKTVSHFVLLKPKVTFAANPVPQVFLNLLKAQSLRLSASLSRRPSRAHPRSRGRRSLQHVNAAFEFFRSRRLLSSLKV